MREKEVGRDGSVEAERRRAGGGEPSRWRSSRGEGGGVGVGEQLGPPRERGEGYRKMPHPSGTVAEENPAGGGTTESAFCPPPGSLEEGRTRTRAPPFG